MDLPLKVSFTSLVNPILRTYMTDVKVVACKRWCFTIRYNEQLTIGFDESYMRYLVYQREKGSQTDYEHWQGYVEFQSGCDLADLQRVFGRAGHYERAKGSAAQNRDYCTKDDTRVEGTGYTEHGKPFGEQGKRSDLGAIAAYLSTGGTLAGVCDDYPSQFIRYHRGLAAYQLYRRRPRTRDAPHVFVASGPTGSGKSLWASQYSDEDCFWKPVYDGSNAQWWDGYSGQKCVIWDDFRESQASLPQLLRLLDRYPVSVQIKGGYVHFEPETIIFTTEEDPKNWYGGHLIGRIVPNLLRRISHVLYFPLPIGCLNPCSLCK